MEDDILRRRSSIAYHQRVFRPSQVLKHCLRHTRLEDVEAGAGPRALRPWGGRYAASRAVAKKRRANMGLSWARSAAARETHP